MSVKDITAREAWKMLEQDPTVRLVDVRRPQEWERVGMPDLTALGGKTLFLTWPQEGSAEQKAAFATTLANAVADRQTPLLFLCRGGVRSLAAALELQKLGYDQVFNIIDGFEGAPGRGEGWRASLPYRAEI
ncbi:hypothetical protein E3E11_05980 [Oecophyllibacter saccharovorans]|uniref:rhodanese-like domain-containing protein n=1 Tax=Oecophyllibacter saccharovorans TaxID=2558360 RepID=UPI00114437C3|nr:rhodanese-like domain-containing protein [Oecophyllibacter saccharovorans]QDH15468.1 hypothetical protein E3E11_05980 [Oecophyllibacter saccharovorans]